MYSVFLVCILYFSLSQHLKWQRFLGAHFSSTLTLKRKYLLRQRERAKTGANLLWKASHQKLQLQLLLWYIIFLATVNFEYQCTYAICVYFSHSLEVNDVLMGIKVTYVFFFGILTMWMEQIKQNNNLWTSSDLKQANTPIPLKDCGLWLFTMTQLQLV